MKIPAKKQRKGFTLIELLTVIAIIGILAGLASAGIPMAMNAANQMSASSNLRSIAQAVVNLRHEGKIINNNGSDAKKYQATTVAGYAEVLARYTSVNTGKTWVVGSDEDGYSSGIPQHVLSEIDDGTNELDGNAISWDVVVNARKNPKDATGYPLAWLRGLQTSGEWDDDSPFGKSVGMIAFADGHVKKVTNLLSDEDQLSSYDGKTQTSSYLDAIGANTGGSAKKPTVLQGQSAN